MSDQFTVKDEGEKKHFASGMVRNESADKVDYHRVYDGPMFERVAAHLTKGAVVYPDQQDGAPNWMKANSREEWLRFRKSAWHHFVQWYRGDTDEDHAAAIWFNVNGAEYVRERLATEPEL